jgi:hypothetical protein
MLVHLMKICLDSSWVWMSVPTSIWLALAGKSGLAFRATEQLNGIPGAMIS